MPTSFRLVCLLLAIAVLGSCQSHPKTASSLLIDPPDGTLLVLHKTITIPPEQAHIYIQHGRVRSVNDTNLYTPNCKLRLKNPRPNPQIIEPDKFRIVQVRHYTDLFQLTEVVETRLAGLSVNVLGGNNLGDIMYVTEIRLQSQKQPAVERLLCQQLDDPGLGEHVSREQIVETLRGIASFEFNES